MTPGQKAYETFHAGRGDLALSESMPWEALSPGLRELWERTAEAGASAAVYAEAQRTALAWLAHVRANIPDTEAGNDVAAAVELTVSCFLDVLQGKAPARDARQKSPVPVARLTIENRWNLLRGRELTPATLPEPSAEL